MHNQGPGTQDARRPQDWMATDLQDGHKTHPLTHTQGAAAGAITNAQERPRKPRRAQDWLATDLQDGHQTNPLTHAQGSAARAVTGGDPS